MATHQGGCGGVMEGFGAVLKNLFVRPRLAWLAIALAAGAFLYLDPLVAGGFSGSIAEIAAALAWAFMLLGATLFTLTLLVDVFEYSTRGFKASKARNKKIEEFLALSGETRALLAFLVLNDRDEIWLPVNFQPIIDIRIHSLGFINQRGEDVLLFQIYDSALEWGRQMMKSAPKSFDEKSKVAMLKAVKDAQLKVKSEGLYL